MAGIDFGIDVEGIDRLNAALAKLTQGAQDKRNLLSALGGMIEDQAKARIEREQASPGGTLWPDWSSEYAKTRHGNNALLQNEGHLFDSIQSLISDDQVEIGTNLIYAATHQYGDLRRGIPQREFMGISGSNLNDLAQVLDDWANNLIK